MHLRYDMIGAHYSGENRHPQVVMKELGLSYQHATPQSIGDQWWFWNVQGDLSNLPEYLGDLELDPMKSVGFGLSEEDAKKIKKLQEELSATKKGM